LSQSDINASDALVSRAQTELRNYWKRNLEEKIGKPGGKFQGRRYKSESAYAFQDENRKEIKEDTTQQVKVSHRLFKEILRVKECMK
jgi:hypothetical protein